MSRDRPHLSPPQAVRLLLAALLLGIGVATMGAAPRAVAEGLIVASEPADRQELERPPGAVTVAFGDVVDDGVAKLLVTDAAGRNVTTGALIVEGTNVTSYLMDDLARGTYTVHYRVDRSDGEVQGGAFQFSYGPGDWQQPADRSWSGNDAEPEVLRNDNPNEPPSQPAPPASTEPGAPSSEPAPSGDPEPSEPEPSVSSEATPSVAATPGAEVPSATAEPPARSDAAGAPVLWWVLGAVLVGAGGLAALLLRRRRGRP